VFLNCLGEHFLQALRRVQGDHAVRDIPIAELTIAVTAQSRILPSFLRTTVF
jgi:hypothetical protein